MYEAPKQYIFELIESKKAFSDFFRNSGNNFLADSFEALDRTDNLFYLIDFPDSFLPSRNLRLTGGRGSLTGSYEDFINTVIGSLAISPLFEEPQIRAAILREISKPLLDQDISTKILQARVGASALKKNFQIYGSTAIPENTVKVNSLNLQ